MPTEEVGQTTFDHCSTEVKGDRLKPKQLDNWIAVLRTDKYEQGNDRLVNKQLEGGSWYCCLGVLQVELGFECGSTYYLAGDTSQDVFDYSLLSEKNQRTLGFLNDIKGASFEDIANWLEANREKVLTE